MKKVVVKAVDVCKSFALNGRQNHVLNNINVDIYEGDFTVIMGRSGAGKSTLLYALSAMDCISAGKVCYHEQEISKMKEKQLAALRASAFGFVFQQTHLVSNLTLFENVVVSGYLQKNKKTSDIHTRADELLKQMHIEEVKHHLPAQVSGGEAQRAAIARAIINEPHLIFADEPTGALNKRNSEEVLDILSQLHQAGQSILMVTHDVRAALRANRLLYLEDGKILDEMQLPVYQEKDIRSREIQVQAWLSSLEW